MQSDPQGGEGVREAESSTGRMERNEGGGDNQKRVENSDSEERKRRRQALLRSREGGLGEARARRDAPGSVGGRSQTTSFNILKTQEVRRVPTDHGLHGPQPKTAEATTLQARGWRDPKNAAAGSEHKLAGCGGCEGGLHARAAVGGTESALLPDLQQQHLSLAVNALWAIACSKDLEHGDEGCGGTVEKGWTSTAGILRRHSAVGELGSRVLEDINRICEQMHPTGDSTQRRQADLASTERRVAGNPDRPAGQDADAVGSKTAEDWNRTERSGEVEALQHEEAGADTGQAGIGVTIGSGDVNNPDASGSTGGQVGDDCGMERLGGGTMLVDRDVGGSSVSMGQIEAMAGTTSVGENDDRRQRLWLGSGDDGRGQTGAVEWQMGRDGEEVPHHGQRSNGSGEGAPDDGTKELETTCDGDSLGRNSSSCDLRLGEDTLDEGPSGGNESLEVTTKAGHASQCQTHSREVQHASRLPLKEKIGAERLLSSRGRVVEGPEEMEASRRCVRIGTQPQAPKVLGEMVVTEGGGGRCVGAGLETESGGTVGESALATDREMPTERSERPGGDGDGTATVEEDVVVADTISGDQREPDCEATLRTVPEGRRPDAPDAMATDIVQVARQALQQKGWPEQRIDLKLAKFKDSNYVKRKRPVWRKWIQKCESKGWKWNAPGEELQNYFAIAWTEGFTAVRELVYLYRFFPAYQQLQIPREIKENMERSDDIKYDDTFDGTIAAVLAPEHSTGRRRHTEESDDLDEGVYNREIV